MIAYLPQGVPKDTARQIHAASDVETQLISEMRINRRGPEGFILGFSGHGIKELTAAAHRLGRAAKSYVDAT
jgi:GntR family transcriptional regulator/MocR family aminotransferase